MKFTYFKSIGSAGFITALDRFLIDLNDQLNKRIRQHLAQFIVSYFAFIFQLLRQTVSVISSCRFYCFVLRFNDFIQFVRLIQCLYCWFSAVFFCKKQHAQGRI